MLVTFERDLHLRARPDAVWSLFCDVPRLAVLIPNVRDVAADGTESYMAQVSDRLGPFQVAMTVRVTLAKLEERKHLEVTVNGSDAVRQNWVRGKMTAYLDEDEEGTRVRIHASLEVLGKLASVGAVPIRRRAEEVFAEFAERLQCEFAPSDERAPERRQRTWSVLLVLVGACGGVLGLLLYWSGLTASPALFVALAGAAALGFLLWWKRR